MKEIAKEIEGDTKALMERWEGNPEHIIEDIFRVRNLDTKEIIPLELTFYQKQFVRAYFFADESTINVNNGNRNFSTITVTRGIHESDSYTTNGNINYCVSTQCAINWGYKQYTTTNNTGIIW